MTHENFENLVMNKLLDGPQDFLISLKKQYLSSKVKSRRFTGYGFFTSFSIPDELVDCSLGGRIDDVKARIKQQDDESLFFILYVENGKIDTLEGFMSYGEFENTYDDLEIVYCYDKRQLDIS